MENIVNNNNNQTNDFDVKYIIKIALKYWYLFVILPILCVAVAAVVKQFTLPEFTSTASILIKSEDASLSKQFLSMSNGLFGSREGEIDDEITVIKSNRLFSVLVESLNLRTETYIRKNMLYHLMYQNEPLLTVFPQNFINNAKGRLTIYISKNSDTSFSFKFEHIENKTKTIEKYKVNNLNEPIKTKWGNFSFVEQQKFLPEKDKNYNLKIVTYSFKGMVNRMNSHINIARNSKSSNILVFTVTSSNPKRNEDILNKLMDIYQQDKISDQNQISRQMAEFITGRLGVISEELKGAEQKVENYKRQHNIVDISTQSRDFIEKAGEYDKQIANVEIQLSLIGFIESYLKKSGATDLLPANTEIKETVINEMIKSYNALVLDYQKGLASATPENPAMVRQLSQINTMKDNILRSISNYKQSAEITKSDLKRKSGDYLSQMRNIPTKEKELVDIQRQQQIKETIFVFLLQKREDAQLSLAMATSSAKIVEPAYTSSSPKTMGFNKMAMFAFVIGLILAATIVYLLQFFKDKISSLDELKRYTKLPIIGTLPHTKNVNYLAITAEKSSILGEKFRMIRTNLSFVMKNKDSKVVLITSSVPEEGKSFVSINMALSLALVGKKVALLGLDVRKPRLAKYLEINTTPGITNFISDETISWQNIEQNLAVNKNVSVFVGGTIPPNPSELLYNERLDLLIDELRKNFDYIIIDSAPVGILTDTFILNRIADAVIFIVRAGVARYSDVKNLNELAENKKFTNVSVLLNNAEEENIASKYGHYGYY